MSDLQGNLAALAREIGADVPKMDAFEVLAEWARRMAGAVAHHADHGCEYRDRIMPWALEVVRADTSDMASVCRRVADAITGVDCDDGWPTDKTGEALHAVCLAGHIGLTDNHTRWPAEAANTVWAFVTGCRKHNKVTAYSRAAWLQQQFSECLTAVNAGRAALAASGEE